MARFELPNPMDDGLLTPEVGEHSFNKHYFLARYIYAFTTGMKNALKGGKWSGLHYIDLFAGAGLERLRDSKQLSWGSPLIAAQSQISFQGLYFCEIDQDKIDALRKRLAPFEHRADIHVVLGDANEKVGELIQKIPARSLSLAFLDPYGLHLDYETLVVLAKSRCDLIIFFPDRVDVLRNWKLNYRDDPASNLDRVLGPSANWRSIFDKQPASRWAHELRELYVRQIKALGYECFEYERIMAKGVPIYQLIFCSKHKLGGRYWRGVSKKKPGQQDTFDFGSPD